jgi:hypothetical protein
MGAPWEQRRVWTFFLITFAWRCWSAGVFLQQRQRRSAGNTYNERPAASMCEYSLAAARAWASNFLGSSDGLIWWFLTDDSRMVISLSDGLGWSLYRRLAEWRRKKIVGTCPRSLDRAGPGNLAERVSWPSRSLYSQPFAMYSLVGFGNLITQLVSRISSTHCLACGHGLGIIIC